MAKTVNMLAMGLLTVALAACQHGAPDQGSSADAKQSAVQEPKAPPASADDNTWGEYLAAKARLHVKGIEQRPYSYVIPPGDTDTARSRRKNEAESIELSVGHILIPGSLLIIGGADAGETNRFTMELPKAIKEGAMTGVTILVVADGKQDKEIAKAFESTGASVRFAAM
jgi:hypothetical protein